MATIADLSGGSGGWPYDIIAEYRLADPTRENQKQAQTFVIIEGVWTVTSVSLWLDRNFTAGGSPEEGNITLEIRENSPSGSILGTSVVERTTVSLSYAWQSFTFSGVELSSGNTYCLVLSCPFGWYQFADQDSIRWLYRTGFYENGARYYRYDAIEWTLDATGRDCRAIVYGDAGSPSKPTNPTPVNNATEVDFSDFTLSWEDGGNADTYNVYIGETGSLTSVSSTQAGVSYITNLSELETIYAVSPIDQKIYWRVDATNNAGTTTGDEWNFDARPPKPSNPSPEHEETNVASSKTPLSYTSSDAAITHDVYFRIKGDSWTQLASEIEDILSWRMPFVYLNIKDYNPAEVSGYRSPIAGDILYDDSDSYTVTYVVRGALYNLQYQAKLYAFRTTGSGVKNRGDVVTNDVIPDVNNPQAVAVTLDDRWFFRDAVEKIYLPQNATYEWRIDATGVFGTVTGNTWEFTTFTFDPPLPTGITLNIEGADGDDPAGVQEGTPTGVNNMITIRGLVAAANDKIWFEDI